MINIKLTKEQKLFRAFLKFSTLFLFFLAFSAQAQKLVQPFYNHANARLTKDVLISRNLPFFDDFSLSKKSLNPALWINGGTTLNNTNALNQPSMMLVSFDGFNAKGIPYNFRDEKAFGATDSLSSQIVDLSKQSPQDSVYLSFFVQNGGFGESPDPEDSLRVQFYTSNGWETALTINAKSKDSLRVLMHTNKGIETIWLTNKVKNTFMQVLMPLKKVIYFHKDFQFRFESFGRQSGGFDAWHIDYVYLDKNRGKVKRFYKDIALRKIQGSLLKNYTAMPFSQFMAKDFKNSIKIELSNLRNGGDFITSEFYVQDTLSKTVLLKKDDKNSTYTDGSINQRETLLSGIVIPTKKSVLKYQYSLNTSDDKKPVGKEDTLQLNTDLNVAVNLRRNDSLATFTTLDDYFAYDDGSAEYGLQMNMKFGKALMKFGLNKPDSVSAVNICFVPFLKDASGKIISGTTKQNVILQIYSNKNQKPDELLRQQSIAVEYNPPNGFIEYQLSGAVAVTDTFYVGWQEISETPVAVGFDKNNSEFADKLFYNLNAKDWIQNTDLKGSLMIRPVMGVSKKKAIITANEEDQNKNWLIIPNPTKGIFSWSLPNITQLQIIDIAGKILINEHLKENQQIFDATELSNGLYFLHLSNQKEKFVQKILIDK